MHFGRKKLRLVSVAGLAAVAMAAAACAASSPSSSSTSGVPVKGGTVTWAELPTSPANWIFPFDTAFYSTGPNLVYFQYLMYRPLYWFGGQDVQPTVNYGLSVADAPRYTDGGKTVTINLKGWKWSNGETVDANDVIFWLNMMKAELDNWADASPGGIPGDITSMAATGPRQVTLHLTAPRSALWFTYNELSQITPMPMAWDVTRLGAKPGSGGCTTDTAADKWAKCAAVYNFLTKQAEDTSTYTTSPIWTVVDGPFKLFSFSTGGTDSFVPNPHYSGSPKPAISVFKEVPFTSDATEYTALKTGAVDIGYIPSADLPAKPLTHVLPTSNPLGPGYTLAPNYDWGFAYYLINFKNPAFGAVFRQLYVRQALEYTDDQEGISKAIYSGYAYPDSGPAPAEPATNPWLPSVQKENGGLGPYPFSIAKAISLLESHGWKMVGGVMTCDIPAKCGAGIKAGQQMKFELDYYTGEAAFADQMQVYKSDASKAGIDITIVGKTFTAVVGEATTSNPSWQAADYGFWGYVPDYEPTGDVLFSTGAGSNVGSYSDPTMDHLIALTESSSSIADYYNFANYAAEQLPFIYMPFNYVIEAVNSKLHGVVFNPVGTIVPEFYYFTK
jgi:peptide/nickel transport system substrate-binding protein